MAFCANLRCYLLFVFTDAILRVYRPPGVRLRENVRIQRLRSLMAESPNARIVIGRDAVLYEDCRLEAFGSGQIEVGEGSLLGGLRAVSRQRIRLGRRLLASWNVYLQDFDPHPAPRELRRAQVEEMTRLLRPNWDDRHESSFPLHWSFPSDEIVIGDDVWLGANSIVLKGARIGDGAIVGAGAVVPKGEYPAGALLVGNPARVKKILHLGNDGIPAGFEQTL